MRFTLCVMRMKISKKIIFLSFALFLLILPASVLAFEVKTGNTVQINENDIIEGNLYIAGNNLSIDGTIKGDVICGAQTVNINGNIEGDVICGAQSLNINGSIGGSVRVAGNTININSAVARGAQAIGNSINLGKNANVGWDMFLAGATGLIQGKIAGDLHGAVANITIDGEVGKNIRLKLNEARAMNQSLRKNEKNEESPLKITDKAKIGGDVIYTSGIIGNISGSAEIGGETKYNQPKIKETKKNHILAWLWSMIYSVFTGLVIGLVLISLWKKQIMEITDVMLEKIGASIGWGAVILFITPIISFFLLFTFIGIPLAFLIIAIWIIAIVLSKIIAGIFVGRKILDKFGKKSKDSLIWAMIIGVVIVKIIFAIPVIGWLLCLVAIFWGLGGIWQFFRNN